MRRIPLVLLLAAAALAGPALAETRCGWVVNPTPGNWWLTDRDDRWIMATQGAAQAAGMDTVPDLTVRQFVRTSGDYGYACGCLSGEFDGKDKTVRTIAAFRQKDLAACRKDRSLPAPE